MHSSSLRLIGLVLGVGLLGGTAARPGEPSLDIQVKEAWIRWLPANVPGGGYMTPSLVSQSWRSITGLKGLMTWSINWDGAKNWTFGDNVKSLQGR